MKRFLLGVACAALLVTADGATAAVKRPPGKFQLVDGDRVVLLGGTLIERAQRYGYIETALTSRYAKRNITFRNLGWSGDNVWGRSWAGFDAPAAGFQKLRRQVHGTRPTVILLGYGANESYASSAGLPEFLAGLDRLLAVLDETKALVVFLSPLRHENAGPPLPDPTRHNKNRRLYAEAIKRVAGQRKAPFIDLDALLGESLGPYTDNGIHLTAYGYLRAAAAIEKGLGLATPDEPSCLVDIEAGNDARARKVVGAKLTGLKASPDRVAFTLLADRLPPPRPPRFSPGKAIAKLPPSRKLYVRGLTPGRYAVHIDGHRVIETDARALAGGIAVERGPEFDQVELLRKTIQRKNKLYFYRWRPQNNTYLFLFRKHEQGNNAAEIPMFDPLVAAKEREIAKLRAPVAHRVEIVRIK